MIKLYINGTELTNFILSNPYKDTIDEELDRTNFQIKSESRLSLSKNSKLRYYNYVLRGNVEKSLIDKNFCIYDWVETLEGEYWLYQITCLSPTKLLENLIINGLASTQDTNGSSYGNLYYQFNGVVDKLNSILTYEGVGITLITDSSNVYDRLGSVASNDFLWDGQQTIREILQDICDKADCLITATDFTNGANGTTNVISSITLQVIEREKSGNQILSSNSSIEEGGLNAISGIVKGLSIHRDSNFNNGNIVSLIKNAISKLNIQSEYMPTRNDDLTIDDASEWHILTDQPIYSLNSVKMLANVDKVSMAVLNNDNTVKYSISPLEMTAEFDITNYVVEKDVFDTMSISEQSKHLYFKRGEKGIYGLYKKYKSGITGLFSNTAMENIIDDIENSFPNPPATHGNFASIVNDRYFGSFNSDYSAFTPASQMTDIINNTEYRTYGNPSDITPYNFQYGRNASTISYSKNILFSIDYQPYCDSVVKLEKNKIAETTNYVDNLCVLKNQNDRTIDARKYYMSQQALINRLGNEEMTLDVMYRKSVLAAYYDDNTNYSRQFFQLGDYITLNSKKWTLTQREIEEYSEYFIKARLTFSLGYNASNSAINVNRDKRLYGIPLNNYIDRYVLFKRPNKKAYSKVAVYCHDDFTGGSSTAGWYILDIVRMGMTSHIDRVSKCMDNYSVGISRTTYSSTKVNIGIRYANTNGTLGYVSLRLLTDEDYNSINISDYSRLPFIPYSALNNNNIGDEVYIGSFNKDKMERLIFVIQP